MATAAAAAENASSSSSSSSSLSSSSSVAGRQQQKRLEEAVNNYLESDTFQNIVDKQQGDHILATVAAAKPASSTFDEKRCARGNRSCAVSDDMDEKIDLLWRET